jgi:hypothetical protein
VPAQRKRLRSTRLVSQGSETRQAELGLLEIGTPTSNKLAGRHADGANEVARRALFQELTGLRHNTVASTERGASAEAPYNIRAKGLVLGGSVGSRTVMFACSILRRTVPSSESARRALREARDLNSPKRTQGHCVLTRCQDILGYTMPCVRMKQHKRGPNVRACIFEVGRFLKRPGDK